MNDHLREMLFGDPEDVRVAWQPTGGPAVPVQRTAGTLS